MENHHHHQNTLDLLPASSHMRTMQKEDCCVSGKEIVKDLEILQRNNLQHLKIVLRSLAKLQGDLVEPQKIFEYSVNDVADRVLCSDLFNSLGQCRTTEVLETVQNKLNELLQTQVLVKSLWRAGNRNVCLSADRKKAIFLNAVSDNNHLMPFAYDALLYIFSLSDEKFRQKHFEQLISFYFNSLREATKRLEKLSEAHAELQIRNLLPVVKFTVADTTKDPEMLTNIHNFLKYPQLHQEDIYEIVKNKLCSDDFELLNFRFVPLNEKNGHLGEYFHLFVKTKFQNRLQEFTVFTKILMATAEIFKNVIDTGVGKKEHFFYTTLLTLYKKMGLHDFLDFAPQCYLVRHYGIVLEDLGGLGYKGLKPNMILELEGLKLIMEKLAKFHSAGMIVEELIKKETGKEFRFDQEYEEYLKESFLVYESNLKKLFDGAIIALLHVAKKLPELTESLGMSEPELEVTFTNFYLNMFSKIKTSTKIRNVINHGDMYVGNMLLKTDQNGSPVRAILVDFQLLRYIPPCFELMFFIYVSSTKSTRTNHLTELLDHYYNCFADNLKQFDLDLTAILPRKDFEDEVNRIKSASIVNAFFYAHIIHSDPDLREEITRCKDQAQYYMDDHRDKFVEVAWSDEHYRGFLRMLMEDIVEMIKRGY
ncbi:uncharacterized protein [Euwallacea fornicatus]|uniref:uncharacterized protein n=1 Tax=Euwallacea fornicatus TaxID=995702 RepID=UPI00338F1334